MRRLRVFQHLSLDGFISAGDPGEYSDEFHNGGWTGPYRHISGLESVLEMQGPEFDLVLGRVTYDLWSGHWPKQAPSTISDGINNATKFVATHHPETLEWGPVVGIGPDVAAALNEIKSGDGPDLILWGSGSVASQAFAAGLVDELVLFVYPAILGRGVRFISNTVDPQELALVSSNASPTGVLTNVYKWVGKLKTA